MRLLRVLCVLAIAIICVASAATAQADFLPANVVNIDFNGYRGTEPLGPTYSGPDGLSGGSIAVWNGLVANSVDGGDMLTVSGTNLLDAAGAPTTIGFSVTPVGGDNSGAGTNPTATAALWGDYIFCNSAGNSGQNPTFTISGLGTDTKIDVYVYGRSQDFARMDFGGVIGTSGGYFQDVPVVGGTVTGHMANNSTSVSVVYGLSIVTPIPEPTTLVLLATGLFGLLCYAWRKQK